MKRLTKKDKIWLDGLLTGQASLLDLIEKKAILDQASTGDFERDMDRIKNLPKKDWDKLFNKKWKAQN